MNDSLWLILIICAVLWFWWDSRGAAEAATNAVKKHCERDGLGLLDDTVSWAGISLKRNARGQVNIQRRYVFEFSSDMRQRYKGEVVMLGQQMVSITLPPYRVQ